MVESGGDDTKVGSHGEQSKYQISYSVWLQHATPTLASRKCFEQYCNTIVAEALAKEHMMWLQHDLKDNSVYWLAAAWHAGFFGVINGTNYNTHDYATRVSNLYASST